MSLGASASENFATGTFTNESRTTNFSVEIPFEPSHFAIMADNEGFPTDNVWKTIALTIPVFGGVGFASARYSTSNINGAIRAANYFSYDSSTHTLSGTVQYNFVEDVTYYWVAW